MKQVLNNMKDGGLIIVETPVPKTSKSSIRIKSTRSLISTGTERMLVDFGKASYINKAKQQPEKVKQVLSKIRTDGFIDTFDAVKSKLEQPITLGYSNVGIIDEVGSDVYDLKSGDRVVSNGGHAEVVLVNKNLCAKVPDNVDDDSAAFTIVASIGLQGIRLANPTLGETFVVIGAGLIGLLTIQILKANGCNVLAVDIDDRKLQLAKSFGATTLNMNSNENLIEKVNYITNDQGADGVIITAASKSNDPIKNAAQISRKRGRIVLVGVVGLDIDRSDFYEKELSFQVSCSYGPGRYDENYENLGNDYPIGFVRWTEKRNFEAVLDLMSKGLINIKPLITKSYEFDDVQDAYNILSNDSQAMGIILKYKTHAINTSKSIALDLSTVKKISDPVVAFIGAGNYATRVLMPAFKETKSLMHSVINQKSANGVIFGNKMGFKYASSDINEVFSNDQIDTLVISTQHDSHAKIALEGLQNNMNIWVEKPLSIDIDGIKKIEDFFFKTNDDPKPQLMVGFNRRFAPHVKKIHSLISDISCPKTFIFTINAGKIDNNHWTQDKNRGGGRIIGEACHFVDLMRFLAGSEIASFNATPLVHKGKNNLYDSASITLRFKDGSIGTILYLANGSSKYPKERIEVFVDGKILKLDNFRKLYGYGWNNFKKMTKLRQDKGQTQSVRDFIDSIKKGNQLIPLEEIFEVSRTVIEIDKMLRK